VDPDISLTLWQKIVQRRTFTQEIIKKIKTLGGEFEKLFPLLDQLLTDDIQDGFPRELMDGFVNEQRSLYQDRIPKKIWDLLSEDRIVTWQESLILTQELVIDIAQDKSWTVLTSKNKRVFSVNRITKTIHVPQKDLNSRKFVAVLFHELVVHVLRFVQHQVVLEGYKVFEEGLASSLQMYILGEPMILYGRNKVRDFLLLLFELGVSSETLQNLFETMQKKSFIPIHAYSWQTTFFTNLDSKKEIPGLKKKYKLYCLGTHRFGRFLKRYNSKKAKTQELAHTISKVLLQAKFDPLNEIHLKEMVTLGILKMSDEDIHYFLAGKYTL
jgi:hypothetical protein